MPSTTCVRSKTTVRGCSPWSPKPPLNPVNNFYEIPLSSTENFLKLPPRSAASGPPLRSWKAPPTRSLEYLFSVGERSRLGCTGRRPRRPERALGNGAEHNTRGACAPPTVNPYSLERLRYVTHIFQ